MSEPSQSDDGALPLALERRLDQVCDQFEAAWRGSTRPRIEDFLLEWEEPERSALLRELQGLERDYCRRRDEQPNLVVDTKSIPVGNGGEADWPTHLGRYQLTAKLGAGAFGGVYRGYDSALRREVAIKVPHRHLLSRPEDVEAYLTEARTVAGLDHPNIVPAFDVGSTEGCPCFIVSKFIAGSTLAQKIRDNRPSFGEAAELVATVAEALHYAHRQGLVHRDIKPGNILLDASGKAYVADFGLALKEENVGKGPKYAGTPAYLSPEQARGEGHRVDGRSDIFSLGLVFYELLTGRRPFSGDSVEELLEQITTLESRPPRQWDDAIPKELERICLLALSKRASERYTTAKDMADDLRHFLAEQTVNPQSGAGAKSARSSSVTATTRTSDPQPSPEKGSDPLNSRGLTPFPDCPLFRTKIVPKGLRSFDAHDADFFLELLPGPRDRDGLPDSIRFWKTRIEETDPDNTFSVGLIYGPSGCGKSSLVKAGLLPRLSEDVLTVYLEATAGETETRLLRGLRKRCPTLPLHLGLKETLAALRRGQSLGVGKKVLIVLDQLEQWLHAGKGEPNTELVQALRQCDGRHVQCIVMVRDDFWMAVTHFMRELEVRLLEGQNSAAVDLFPVRHAEKVLAAFGRAFGVLPDRSKETSTEQNQFLEQAVSGLAQEGKIICVRLALFAEMMKGKPWTPTTLKRVGGPEGVGAAFLEETFSAATAPPEHRYHQQAARAVLKALLPESGTDIKGHRRSHAELLQASGYAGRSRDFDDLIRVLDSEIRLITPADPEGLPIADCRLPIESHPDGHGAAPDSQSAIGNRQSAMFYQLTHDYLVPSLRDWLTRKQKETRHGRAELLLADRASVWNARPENRQLPSFPQWVAIHLLTQKKNWTQPQRQMMQKATRYHAVRGAALAVLLLILLLTGLGIRSRVVEQQKAGHAAGLVQRLVDADITQVPGIIAEIEDYRAWADPLLREENDKAAKEGRRKLRTSLALLPVDSGRVNYLYGRLLDAQPHEVPVLRDALSGHKEHLVHKLWSVVEQPARGKESQRLRAACALAGYDLDSPRWAMVQNQVANDLVGVPAVHLASWMDSLRPVRARLLTPLAAVFRNPTRRETERSLATDILADYAVDQPDTLAELVQDADDKQFTRLLGLLNAHRERGVPVLCSTVATLLESKKTDADREILANRQANAAVALLRMGHADKAWPLLKHSSDPRARSYLIHRLVPLGADAGAILKRLDEEPDVTIRRALLLSLGEYGKKEFSAQQRKVLLPKLQEMYRRAPDPGLHGAAEWLLRTWKQQTWLKQVNQEWAKDKQQRDERVKGIQQMLAKGKEKTPPQWYVNGQGLTMVVIPGPVEFLMGSPPTEADRDVGPVGKPDLERQHQKRIGRSFALAAKEVTVKQFRRFYKDYFHCDYDDYSKEHSPTGDSPVNMVSWYQAAAYCNWLSKQERIAKDQWCYQPNSKGEYAEGMKLAPDYLKRTGYRLPSEAEWEYACRAKALTSRFYGDTEELLAKYAWYEKNAQNRSGVPGDCLKPNDLGLFDMLGHAAKWCQESNDYYAPEMEGKASEDKEDKRDIKLPRVLRLGGITLPAKYVRSAYRSGIEPTNRSPLIGFRPARTLMTE